MTVPGRATRSTGARTRSPRCTRRSASDQHARRRRPPTGSGRVRSSTRRRARSGARPAARGIQHVEDVVGRGDALGGGVELHAHLTQRQIRLGGEQQHEQPDAEGERAVDQPEPDRHRDDRDRDAREELEREPREERHPQHLHRLAAVVVGDLLDGCRGPVLPPEHLERRQALDGVGEARREALQRLPLPLLHRAGGQADQHHEERDERDRQQHGEPGDPVLRPHHQRRSAGVAMTVCTSCGR